MIATITVHADGSSQSMPITVSPSTGALTFNGDVSSLRSYTAAGSGAGYVDDTNTPVQNYHYRGHITWLGPLNGQPTIDIAVPLAPTTQPSGGPGGWWCASFLHHTEAMTPGNDLYLGQSIWVPPGGLQLTGASPPNIGEFYANVGGQACWMTMLYNDHISLNALLGAFDPNARQWQYSRNNLPALYAVPPGGFVPGQWNSWIVHWHWATDSTGIMESWYRGAGGAWTSASKLTGVPTLVWNTGSPPPANMPWNGPMLYCKAPPSTPFSVQFGGPFGGSSFSAVAARLP